MGRDFHKGRLPGFGHGLHIGENPARTVRFQPGQSSPSSTDNDLPGLFQAPPTLEPGKYPSLGIKIAIDIKRWLPRRLWAAQILGISLHQYRAPPEEVFLGIRNLVANLPAQMRHFRVMEPGYGGWRGVGVTVVGVEDGSGVWVGVGSGVTVGCGVCVGVGSGVAVGCGVWVGVGSGKGVFVGSAVGMLVGLGVGAAMGKGVGVTVGLGVWVGVLVGLGTGVGAEVTVRS